MKFVFIAPPIKAVLFTNLAEILEFFIDGVFSAPPRMAMLFMKLPVTLDLSMPSITNIAPPILIAWLNTKSPSIDESSITPLENIAPPRQFISSVNGKYSRNCTVLLKKSPYIFVRIMLPVV